MRVVVVALYRPKETSFKKKHPGISVQWMHCAEIVCHQPSRVHGEIWKHTLTTSTATSSNEGRHLIIFFKLYHSLTFNLADSIGSVPAVTKKKPR